MLVEDDGNCSLPLTVLDILHSSFFINVDVKPAEIIGYVSDRCIIEERGYPSRYVGATNLFGLKSMVDIWPGAITLCESGNSFFEKVYIPHMMVSRAL